MPRACSSPNKPIRSGSDRPNLHTDHAAMMSKSRRATPFNRASSPGGLARPVAPLIPSSPAEPSSGFLERLVAVSYSGRDSADHPDWVRGQGGQGAWTRGSGRNTTLPVSKKKGGAERRRGYQGSRRRRITDPPTPYVSTPRRRALIQIKTEGPSTPTTMPVGQWDRVGPPAARAPAPLGSPGCF